MKKTLIISLALNLLILVTISATVYQKGTPWLCRKAIEFTRPSQASSISMYERNRMSVFTPALHEAEGRANGLALRYELIDLDIRGVGLAALPALLREAEERVESFNMDGGGPGPVPPDVAVCHPLTGRPATR